MMTLIKDGEDLKYRKKIINGILEYNMNHCKDCVVDMICFQKCLSFGINLERLKTDELVYLKRCMNNIENTTYEISKNIKVKISEFSIGWYKDGEWHRSNDKPAVIFFDGSRYWYKNGKRHRDNDKPAIVYGHGSKRWYKNGVEYEPM